MSYQDGNFIREEGERGLNAGIATAKPRGGPVVFTRRSYHSKVITDTVVYHMHSHDLLTVGKYFNPAKGAKTLTSFSIGKVEYLIACRYIILPSKSCLLDIES